MNLHLSKFRMLTVVIVLLSVSYPLFSQNEKELVIGEQPTYHVAKAKGPIVADGKMDETSWKDAEGEMNHWKNKTPNSECFGMIPISIFFMKRKILR